MAAAAADALLGDAFDAAMGDSAAGAPPQLPAPGTPALLGLPYDCRYMVFEYLRGTEVATLSMACRGLREATSDPRLWRDLYTREFQPTLIGLVRKHSLRLVRTPSGAETDHKGLFASRVRAIVRDRLAHIAARRSRRQEYEMAKKRRCGRRFLDFWQVSLVVPTPFICMLVCAVNLRSYLADASADATSLYGVFAPLLVMVFVTCVAFALGLATAAHRHDDNSAFSRIYQNDDLPYFATLLLRSILGSRPTAFAHICVLFGLFVLQVVLAISRASGDFDASWGLVLLPTWLILPCWCCAPLTGWEGIRHQPKPFLSLSCVALCPLVAFFIMLAIWADGTDIPLAGVFTPFWVIDLAGLCGSVWLVREMRRMFVAQGVGEMLRGPGLALTLLCAFLAPLIAFEIMASVADSESGDEAGMTAADAMVPLIVEVAFMVIASLVACAVMHAKAPRLEELPRLDNVADLHHGDGIV